jgi:hypothetical protein
MDLRDGSEHCLVPCIQEIRKSSAANRGLSKYILEAEVVKSTNELAGVVGEGKRVTPEEPLERDNSGSHDRKPDERES